MYCVGVLELVRSVMCMEGGNGVERCSGSDRAVGVGGFFFERWWDGCLVGGEIRFGKSRLDGMRLRFRTLVGEEKGLIAARGSL